MEISVVAPEFIGCLGVQELHRGKTQRILLYLVNSVEVGFLCQAVCGCEERRAHPEEIHPEVAQPREQRVQRHEREQRRRLRRAADDRTQLQPRRGDAQRHQRRHHRGRQSHGGPPAPQQQIWGKNLKKKQTRKRHLRLVSFLWSFISITARKKTVIYLYYETAYENYTCEPQIPLMRT